MTNSRLKLAACLGVNLLMFCCVSAPVETGAEHEGKQPFFEEIKLFEKGKHGYFCYRIPALVISTQGTILAFAEARRTNCRDDDDTDLVVKRSFDNGKTWSDLQVIADDATNTMGNPCAVVDRETDIIWLSFTWNNQKILLTKSTDDGMTWAEPVDITESAKDPNWSYVGTGPGHGIQLKNGRLLIPSWGDTSPGPVTWKPDQPNWGKVQFSYAFFSDDHGKTWTRGEILTKDASDECEVVETIEGSLYMNMRSRQTKHRRAFAWSQDGGETWSEVKYDETLPEPSCQGGLVRFTDQGQFEKNRVLLSHPSRTEERSHLTVRVSYDESRTWPVSKLIYAGSSAYSDLGVAPDMAILCLYEADKYSKIVFARFNIEWLTDGIDFLQKK